MNGFSIMEWTLLIWVIALGIGFCLGLEFVRAVERYYKGRPCIPEHWWKIPFPPSYADERECDCIGECGIPEHQWAR